MLNISEKKIMENWKGDIESPIISICTITYAHESFIEEALDSFLSQETDFAFEIVLDDDKSPDMTAKIVQKYMQKYPNIIKANLRNTNVGAFTNFQDNIRRASGKYIAVCEGDDYWIDIHKLQTQVEFLEENDDYYACFHDSKSLTIHQDGTKQEKIRIGKRKIDETVNLVSLITENNIATASIVFRNSLQDYPKYILETTKGDYALMVMMAERGLIKYISRVMSVYRLHEGGIWSLKTHDYQAQEGVKFYKLLEDHFQGNKEIVSAICKKMKYEYFNLAMALIRQKKRLVSLKYLVKSFGGTSMHKNISYTNYLKTFIKIHL